MYVEAQPPGPQNATVFAGRVFKYNEVIKVALIPYDLCPLQEEKIRTQMWTEGRPHEDTGRRRPSQKVEDKCLRGNQYCQHLGFQPPELEKINSCPFSPQSVVLCHSDLQTNAEVEHLSLLFDN